MADQLAWLVVVMILGGLVVGIVGLLMPLILFAAGFCLAILAFSLMAWLIRANSRLIDQRTAEPPTRSVGGSAFSRSDSASLPTKESMVWMRRPGPAGSTRPGSQRSLGTTTASFRLSGYFRTSSWAVCSPTT